MNYRTFYCTNKFSIFVVEFFGTPHPRIYILNEIISKNLIAHFNEKRNGMQHPPIVHFNEKRNGMQHPPIVQ